MNKKFPMVLFLPLDIFFIFLVKIYQTFISPLKPKTCRFTPTCSTYMILCIKEFHFAKGIVLGLKRLARCTPRAKGGFDPIPLNIKGETKWII